MKLRNWAQVGLITCLAGPAFAQTAATTPAAEAKPVETIIVTGSSIRRQVETRCLIPVFDGAISARQWRDSLWDKFYTGAPQRQRQSVERYNIVKKA